MKKALLALVVAALAIPAAARAERDLTGTFALGYWNAEAPIGGRYVISKSTALDLGVGFAQAPISDDPTTATVGDEAKNMQFHVAAGIPFTIVRREKVNFFVRPGVMPAVIATVEELLENGINGQAMTLLRGTHQTV